MAGSSTKRVAPAALTALVEAVSSIYWYKDDLIAYLTPIVGGDLTARLDRSEAKRAMVRRLLTYMNERFAEHGQSLLDLMIETSKFDSFVHLERLDDGELKVEAARSAVDALRSYAGEYVRHEQEREMSAVRRAELAADAAARTELRGQLDDLRRRFLELTQFAPRERGIAFETLLADLFELFDLAPRRAFNLVGEQIDGFFAFDGADYILEAKWHNERIQPGDLGTFTAKVGNRIENTLGLFWSYSGFTENAVQLNSRRRSMIMLADGADLMAILDSRIDLPELLREKRRHAAQTGNVMISATEILST